jgi:hypothetical protein
LGSQTVRGLPPQVQHGQQRERPVLPQVRPPGRASKPSAWAKELTPGSFAHRVKILVSPSVVMGPLTVSHLHRPQHRPFWKTRPRVPRIRIQSWTTTLRQQFQLPQRQSDQEREYAPSSLLTPSFSFPHPSVDRATYRQGAQEDCGGERNHKVRKPPKAVECIPDPRHAHKGKTTRIGQKRTSLESKSSRSALPMITSPLR